ncbi:hypothetical protein [Occallatibacter riparius]|uniref:Uncharacterized protein n=1 Tax=Occallatibacter riparius TaxID=1002689 RepID=A0A9J7BNW4_9BACT|nr:hypothetical protein [Occallatibacter riparius]UWZ82606.1 hypothetical protein MOP44_18790 [Occallatibacter riparius]
MKFTKLLASAIFASLAIPAFAGVTVASPTAGESVNTSFTLSANASACSSQQVGSMGYSWDSSSSTATSSGNSISKTISAPATGTHTLHVKAWGLNGASCVADVTVAVNSSVSTGGTGALSAPSYATKVSSLQTLSSWKSKHDAGTTGTSSGTMSMTGSPSKSGNARKFFTSFTNYGGQRYSVSIADDVNAKNFLYDGWIFLHNTATTVSNIEMDVNQVMSNGLTVIFGFQCSKWTGTWDYTANKGSASYPKDAWIHSAAKCNPTKWAQNTWHHVQIRYSRDSSGYVTYQSVALDGAVQSINAKVFSAFKLGWAPTILTNFQIGGALSGSGSSTAYLDNLALYRW